MILDLADEDVELLFSLVMDAPVPRRRTDRVAYAMAEQMQAHKARIERQTSEAEKAGDRVVDFEVGQ